MPSQKKTNSPMLQAQSKQDSRLVSKLARAIDARLPKSSAKKKQSQAQKRLGIIPSTAAYAKMIDDPCGAELVPGIYGSNAGYLARFHVNNGVQNVTNGTCGVVLWAPNYCNIGYSSATQTCWNIYQGVTVGIDDALILSGTGGAATGSGGAIADPAYTFASGDSCAGTRCIGACIRFSYTGSVSNAQGQISAIRVPFAVVEEAVNGSVTLSPSRLLQYATDTRRMPLDTLEVKWRPSADDTFRSTAGANAVLGDDALIRYNTGVYSIGTKATQEQPYFIGFVWRGVANSGGALSTISYDFYKNVEWTPSVASGLASQNAFQMGDSGTAQRAVAFLDRAKPGWDSAMVSAGKSYLARTAMTAFALV